MMRQRVLKQVAKVENGAVVYSYEVAEREFLTPSGSVVLDADKLERKVSNALDHIYYAELADTVRKATDRVETLEKSDNCSRDDMEKAVANLSELKKKISAYPALTVEYDDFSMLLAGVITASKVISVKLASDMLTALRTDADLVNTSEVKKVVVDYVNRTIRLNECDYVKPYDASGLNIAKVENLRKIATISTRKWTAKGITSKSENDRKVWQQVMLTIFEECFRLAVVKDGAALFTA